MANFKCKMCGAPLNVQEGMTVVTCDYCQSKQTVANANDERKENLFNRANALRIKCEFDKATLSYQSILSMFPNEPEAHWGLCLCKYGIEYISDPSTGRKKPTIHRVSFDSILKDTDYKEALNYADIVAKEEYQREAQEIANIQKNILSISQKEEPFDIFISYKDTDENGKRTPDSVLAQEIYSNLTNKGYKVFFSRITLENKLGTLYEPYIFAALNSAKIMLVVGTKKEYFESIWVKNEWSRFIDLMRTRPDHYLIPCYKNINAYEMPEQFLSFQGQDMSKLGFMQDLTRGIDKIMGKNNNVSTKPIETQIIYSDVNINALLKRAEILISDSNFTKADEILEKVLDNDPTNSQAYLLKLLIDLEVDSIDELKDLDHPLDGYPNFDKAYDFGGEQQKKRLNSINEAINNRNEEAKLENLYNVAINYKNAKKYTEAEAMFVDLNNYKDSPKQALDCIRLRKEELYDRAIYWKEQGSFQDAIEFFEQIIDFKDSKNQISICKQLSNKAKYEEAISLKESGHYEEAIEIFKEIVEYQDSDSQIDECTILNERAKKEAIYQECIFNREINPSVDSYHLRKACEKLKTILDYKDSAQLIEFYEGILIKYAKESKIKREEAIRLKKIKRKKTRKILLFSFIGAITITGILLLTFLVFIPAKRQDNIQKLINNGDYNQAYELIDKNGNFGDNKNLLEMCKAGESFSRLDYETGISYIYDINGSVDVTYDNNGGTSAKSNETIKKSKRTYIDNECNREGYTFYGWVLTDYSINASKHSASISLIAKWDLIEYSITYNLVGGESSTTLPTKYNVENETHIPNLTKKGYTFLGWTGLDLKTKTLDLVIPTGSTGNKKYTANWKANEYTIYLNANGGNVSTNELKVTYDQKFSLPTPIYNGYDFLNWKDENSLIYSDGIYKEDGDLYLTATWTAHNYNITYELNGGINSNDNPYSYTIENEDIYLKEPTKTGYTFIGWTNSEIKEPTKAITIDKGSIGNKSFTANWKANNYEVSIELNGGVSNIVDYTFTFDSSYSINIPNRVGYIFDKFTYDDGKELPTTGVWKIDKDIIITAEWIANSDTKYIINHYIENLDGLDYTKIDTDTCENYSDSTITLYPNTYEGFTALLDKQEIKIAADGSTVVDFYYFRNSYEITFETNGGDTINSQMFKYEDKIPTTLVPEREGYTFDGWYKDDKQTLLFDTMPADNQTVYAYYKEETKAHYFDYEYVEDRVTISKANGVTGKVVVPEYIGGKLVTSIGNSAFKNCNSITEVTLSNSINELGASAFSGCTSLVKINGTSDLNIIRECTFENCAALSYFPNLNNVEMIGNRAFYGCSSLTTLGEIDGLTTIGNYAFTNCVMLLQTPDLTNVTSIGNYAFQDCTLLTEIKSLEGCATFGEGVFSGCENIAKITLSFSKNIEEFYTSSFFKEASDTTKFYSIIGKYGSTYYIPKRLTEIEYDTVGKTPDYFLYNLTSIIKVTDKSTLTTTIGKHAFDGCTNLTDYTIQKSAVSLIKEYAFKNCTSLTTLPEFPLEKVEKYAFANCSSLLTTPSLENVNYIGDYAFSGCSLITSFKLDNASYMGLNSLYKCSSLVELEIPFVGTTSNSSEAFGVIFGTSSYDNSYAVTQLSKTYYIPNGLTKLTIGGTTIKDGTCTNLTTVTDITINDSITFIGKGAFNGFNSLESITLPFVGRADGTNDYTSVFGYIFGYTTITSGRISKTGNETVTDSFFNKQYSSTTDGSIWQFSRICTTDTTDYKYMSYYYYIPSSLKNVSITMDTTIPAAAFNGCTMLEKVTMPNETTTIGTAVFQNCTTLKQLNSNQDGLFNIPNTITSISDYAFYSCSLASEITLNDAVIKIGNYAFAKCSLVDKFNSDVTTNLIVPESCQQIGNYAFKGMALMTNVVVKDGVESIGVSAFNGFNSLESITLPFVGRADGTNDYTSVFGYIFGYTTITSGRISKTGNETVTDSFFNKQYSSTTDGSIWQFSRICTTDTTDYKYMSYYYYIPSSLKNVSITMDTTIPAAAFNGCTMLEKVTMPNETTTIGTAVFQNCTTLKQLNSNQDGLFNIPNTITSISDYAFYSCSLASEITLNDAVIKIGNYAFAKCSLVDKFNSDVTTNLIVPESCQQIGNYAFKGMALMTNVVVKDGVESIGVSAFNGFNSLESITLPFVGRADGTNDYTSVFGYIFGYTTITSGRISKTGNETVTDSFFNKQYSSTTDGSIWQFSRICTTDTTDYKYMSYYYYIPSSLKNVSITMDTTIPAAAFNGCKMIEKIHLVNCIDYIGNCAFQNCVATVDYSISPTKSGAWDGTTIATIYHGGAGTQADPYQIFSAKEFIFFLNQIRNGEKYENTYFVLTSNINLGGFTINPTSLTESSMFKGILNGNSHKVFNFAINNTDNSYNGLFGYMGGTIKNIGFETSMSVTSSVTTDIYVGMIVGILSGTLENVYVAGTLTSTSLRTSYIGGLVGHNTGTIINSYSNVTISAISTNLKCYAGGLVGYNDGTISGSFAYGSVSANGYADTYSYASGLAAYEGTNSNVTNCYRYSGQNIIKFGSVSTSNNSIGKSATLAEIIAYCKENWDGSVWSYKKTLPSF